MKKYEMKPEILKKSKDTHKKMADFELLILIENPEILNEWWQTS